jgi:hypothetical protein
MVEHGSGLLDPALWLAVGGGLGIGLLIGLERERNPAAKAGVRTFALVSLLGTLAALAGIYVNTDWLLPAGLLAVTGMLIVAYARVAPGADTCSARWRGWARRRSPRRSRSSSRRCSTSSRSWRASPRRSAARSRCPCSSS